MSATNRGGQRVESDFYATPIETIENILNNLELNNYGDKILEPSAGNGNISKTIKRYYPNKHLTSIELRSEEEDNLTQFSDKVVIGDFLELQTNEKYNIIIGNPPYSLALEFVEKSLELLEEDGGFNIFIKNCFLRE